MPYGVPKFMDFLYNTIFLGILMTVRNWIHATLARPVLADVHTIDTAIILWQTLQQRYRDVSMARQLELRQHFHSFRKESLSPDVYCRDLKSLADQLRDLNISIAETDLIAQALAGLDSDYKDFVTMVANLETTITYQNFRCRLVAYDDRRLRMDSLISSPNEHKALTTAAIPPSNSIAPISNYRSCGSGSRGRGRSGRGGGRYFSTGRGGSSSS
ncbi:uncharacterized protein LOC120010529 [Tripterygium wilfordii]|uniref:uncharacterized protein LOC120010529 n=1 Tax=Tripterygium wilfordii TaxID=458696 RepID=UPI0018F7EEC8|nr:uncharacterized protein LOC120010529 [Tripterygium wilfordii]